MQMALNLLGAFRDRQFAVYTNHDTPTNDVICLEPGPLLRSRMNPPRAIADSLPRGFLILFREGTFHAPDRDHGLFGGKSTAADTIGGTAADASAAARDL